MSTFPPLAQQLAHHFCLDPEVIFLNHGSFGACPRAILDRQGEWRRRMEREPVLFLGRELEHALDEARGKLAEFLGADADDLAFVPNATTGVNTVLRSLAFQPGDQILITNHEYNACRNAVVAVAERARAEVVVAAVPFPLASADDVVGAIMRRVTSKTRLVLVDHITSQTGLLFPIARIVQELLALGIDTMVDGAHAPGMVPLDLRVLRAAYYTGNCHKWLCAPKGAAFLHVRRDRQAGLLPIAVSHGYNSPRSDRSRFRLLFDWGGTTDPSAFLCIPDCIQFLCNLLPGGIAALQDHNHQMACAGRALLCDALAIDRPCPDGMLGSLAAVPLPGAPATAPRPPLYLHPLQTELFDRHRIEVPIMAWPAAPQWQLRISAQIYNEPAHYRALARALASRG
ncbi:MAG: aminotransferase class V-fold PLP-dependent enzyme [Planctomycetota bacterium]